MEMMTDNLMKNMMDNLMKKMTDKWKTNHHRLLKSLPGVWLYNEKERCV